MNPEVTAKAISIIRSAIDGQRAEAPDVEVALTVNATMVGIIIAQNNSAVANEILRICEDALDSMERLELSRQYRDLLLDYLRDE